MIKKKNTVKIHAPPEFREFLYRKKAQKPNSTLQGIMKDIALEDKLESKKKDEKKLFPDW